MSIVWRVRRRELYNEYFNSDNLACRKKTNETWRYISYSLVHANLEHILLNVFLLVSVGCGLEAVHGTLRVAVLYLLGVSRPQLHLIWTFLDLFLITYRLSQAPWPSTVSTPAHSSAAVGACTASWRPASLTPYSTGRRTGPSSSGRGSFTC